MKIQDRIIRLDRIPPKDIEPNPQNWRVHGAQQRMVLRGVLQEIGYAGASIAYVPDARKKDKNPKLRYIDGHMRAEENPEQPAPTLILDVNDEEAAKIMLTYDPIAGLATKDDGQLDALLQQTSFGNADVQDMLDSMGGADEGRPGKIEELQVLPPAETVWILLAIPTKVYGEVFDHVEALCAKSELRVQVSRD